MYNFTEEQKLKIEKEFLAGGLESTILNSNIVKNILCNKSNFSKRIFEVINSYEEYKYQIELLEKDLNQEGIKTRKI